jgi:hypothetical protein
MLLFPRLIMRNTITLRSCILLKESFLWWFDTLLLKLCTMYVFLWASWIVFFSWARSKEEKRVHRVEGKKSPQTKHTLIHKETYSPVEGWTQSPQIHDLIWTSWIFVWKCGPCVLGRMLSELSYWEGSITSPKMTRCRLRWSQLGLLSYT